jgi:hypothetical protein
LANIWLYMLEGGNELEVKYDAKLWEEGVRG